MMTNGTIAPALRRAGRTTNGGWASGMRLIHTSDWHLGRTLHGESLLAHQAAFLEWLIDQAVSSRADAVVVAGDVYDRAVPGTDAVALLVDNVPGFLAPRLGKPLGEPFSVRIRTTDPERDYLLTSAEGVAVIDWPGEQPAADVAGTRVTEVSMPAEALLRLAYGRLDPEHTPESVSGDPADLDRLRKIFPGF